MEKDVWYISVPMNKIICPYMTTDNEDNRICVYTDSFYECTTDSFYECTKENCHLKVVDLKK